MSAFEKSTFSTFVESAQNQFKNLARILANVDNAAIGYLKYEQLCYSFIGKYDGTCLGPSNFPDDTMHKRRSNRSIILPKKFKDFLM